ncbi:MAG: hypothetical protein WCB27_22630 [Thermoguttaceae bacterium]|jgi:hypothetical protein
MHARELIELAALVSAQGPVLVRSDHRIPAGGIERYWTTSKIRIDRWARSLKDLALQADARQRERKWPETRGVLEEILTGEILTRVWAAVLCAYDRSRGSDEAEPVARSVMIGHSEARHRVLKLVSHVTGIDARWAVRLNRLRRHAERWTDLLVGRLADIQAVGEFAVDAKRAMDFAEDAPSRQGFEASRLAWPLLLAALRKAFQRELGPISPNADLNAGIAASVLSCFPSEPLDSSGLFRSLWLLRITSVAEEATRMIEALLAPEPSDSSSPHCIERCV